MPPEEGIRPGLCGQKTGHALPAVCVDKSRGMRSFCLHRPPGVRAPSFAYTGQAEFPLQGAESFFLLSHVMSWIAQASIMALAVYSPFPKVIRSITECWELGSASWRRPCPSPRPLRLLTHFTRVPARRINFCFVLALLIIIVILKRNAAMWEINPPVPFVKRRFSSSRQHVVVGRVRHPPYFFMGDAAD